MVNLERRKLGSKSTIINGYVYPEELEFWDYHEDNPEIYHLFCRYAEIAISRGHTRLSPWLIINRIRWEQEVMVKTDEPFKISNKYIAYYSRYWMKDKNYPEFFVTRTMIGEFIEDELQETST